MTTGTAAKPPLALQTPHGYGPRGNELPRQRTANAVLATTTRHTAPCWRADPGTSPSPHGAPSAPRRRSPCERGLALALPARRSGPHRRAATQPPHGQPKRGRLPATTSTARKRPAVLRSAQPVPDHRSPPLPATQSATSGSPRPSHAPARERWHTALPAARTHASGRYGPCLTTRPSEPASHSDPRPSRRTAVPGFHQHAHGIVRGNPFPLVCVQLAGDERQCVIERAPDLLQRAKQRRSRGQPKECAAIHVVSVRLPLAPRSRHTHQVRPVQSTMRTRRLVGKPPKALIRCRPPVLDRRDPRT